MIIGTLYIVEYIDKNAIARTENNVNLMSLTFPVAGIKPSWKNMNKKYLMKSWTYVK